MIPYDPTYEKADPLPALLTIGEAAERLRISVPTLKRHISAGRIPACRVGGTVRLEVRAVNAFVEPYEIRSMPTEGATN